MAIDHIIVHRLKKERGEASTLHTRRDELAPDPAAEHLLEGILETYDKKTGKAYGTFQPDRAEYPFSGYLERYLEGAGNGFAAFSRQSMDLLKKRIDDADWATGGYVVFILYPADGEPGSSRHLIVAMLNDRRGTAVDAETLEIRDVTHLVIDELHLAARIDLEAWRAGAPEHYLSFIKGRRSGATVSRYFRDFLGCAEFADARGQSRKLLRVIKSFGASRQLSKPQTRRVRKIVYDHAVERAEAGEQVDLTVISSRIDPDSPHDFLAHANAEETGLSDRFDPDLPVLRRLGRFSGSDDELSLSFEAQLLGNRVQYDKTSKSLTIIRLPKGLERQLDEAV